MNGWSAGALGRAGRVGLVVLVVAGILAGCGGSSSHLGTDKSMGAPPTVVCGTVLWSGAAGAVVEPIWQSGPITETSVGNDVFLRVSRGCTNGSEVSLAPASAASIVRSAKAKDGQYAAVVLHPATSAGTVVVTAESGGELVGRRTLRLSS